MYFSILPFSFSLPFLPVINSVPFFFFNSNFCPMFLPLALDAYWAFLCVDEEG